jgi:DNA primase
MSIPPDVLDEIRARVDRFDLISAAVPLKRAGERWKGLCPFHQEKTPSFTVNPKLGIFHCFGCHTGGDAFEFLRRHDRLDFPEAVRILAERTGVTLPGRDGDRSAAGPRDGLHALLDWAARRFEAWLWERPDGERARRYLGERGIATDTAHAFRLGYAPDGWDHLLGAARAEGYTPEALLGAGLVLPRQTGTGHYDRFRGRLLFPIADAQGRVIAFGGRALGPEEPKYLNSPETALYQKGQTLYALHLAKEPMGTSRRALLVEGYIDCVMAHQAGVRDTVAVLGTALTPHHLGLLRRYADEAILFFDADRAGAEAARRAEDLLEQSSAPHWWALSRRADTLARPGLRLRVATLPAGHDPDTFLREAGREAFEARCQTARPLLLYALDRIFTEVAATGAGGLAARATGVARVARMLAKVQDADEAIELGRAAARRLGIDASDLWLQAQRVGVALRTTDAASGRSSPAPPAPPASFDRDLLLLLVHHRPARALLPLVDPQDVGHAALREIFEMLQADPGIGADALLARLPGEAARGLLTRLVAEEPEWPDPAGVAADVRRRLEDRQRRRRIRTLTQALAAADAPGAADPERLVAIQDEARRLRAMRAATSAPLAGAPAGEAPDRARPTQVPDRSGGGPVATSLPDPPR